MKANTIIDPIGIKVVNPVKHVSRIRYENSDTQSGGGSFQQALESAEKKEEKTTAARVAPNEVLETMAGMNQYDRHAREIFFVMSSQTDYKC